MADNLKDLEGMHVAMKEFRQISKNNRVILLNMLSHEHEVLGDSVDDPCLKLKSQYFTERAVGQVNRIYYIKEVRNLLGLGLKEAKDLVESW